MQLLNTILALAIASIVAAEPQVSLISLSEVRLLTHPIIRTTTELNKRKLRFWWVVGYGNPNCGGDILWSEIGDNSTCKDVPRLAASYSWAVTQVTEFHSWPEPDACNNQNPGKAKWYQPNPVGSNDGQGHWGCMDTPVNGFSVEL